MNKNAQIAVFVIVIVVMIGIAVLMFFVFGGEREARLDIEHFEQAHIKEVLDNIKSSVIECMEDKSMNALDTIGIQGGYYDQEVKSYQMDWAFIPYYYDRGDVLMPSRGTIERELAKYVDDTLKICLDDLRFENFELTYQRPSSRATIKPQEVEFLVSLEVGVTHEKKKTKLELVDVPINHFSFLFEILEVATFITSTHRDNPEMVCINCIADMAYERDLYVDFLEFRGDLETLVIITENKTRVEPYIFEFLNKYPEVEE